MMPNMRQGAAVGGRLGAPTTTSRGFARLSTTGLETFLPVIGISPVNQRCENVELLFLAICNSFSACVQLSQFGIPHLDARNTRQSSTLPLVVFAGMALQMARPMNRNHVAIFLRHSPSPILQQVRKDREEGHAFDVSTQPAFASDEERGL